MGLTESEVQSYLRQKFQGRDSFLDNIIFPIFGEERFENGFDDPVLEDDADLKDAAEKCGIKSIIRYGDIQIDLGSIHLFEITVSNRVLLKRNRVNVQRIVRRMMGTYTGAFMIFHYDDEAAWDWRFSFCCKDDKNFTEAKRYTFLLGENQPCRTAAQNFCTLAKVRGDGRVPALADIVEAFDVEAVSRDFFNQYKEHYERFVRYITGKYFKKENGKFVEKDEGTANEAMYAGFNHDDKAVRDYVKKLLGRIVFLHFLQKKGWMGAKKGWSDGDPDFLLELYHKSSDKQKGDFLDSVLEPLFSEALDTDRREQDDFFDTGVIGVGKVRIPYLNGGLFTRDKADEVKSAFPRDYFHNLLGFLSEYNFTIDENDPNDAEVGVDPEMLSRIFENLLEDNRDKGAFYTPKAVVDYMCRRSLTANLCVGQSDADCKKIERFVQTHDAEKLTRKLASTILRKLKDVKVCDPAIGSGAFPMGMLKLIYLSRIALGDETPPSTLKKEIIENNIYGVDIEKGAVDIARLRFWLALIVDEDTPNALPNLDFKIMQGNSLLENYKGVDLSGLLLSDVAVTKRKAKQGKLELGKIAQSVSQGELAFGGDSAAEIITAKMRQYYSETNHQTKKSLMRDIGEQVNGFIKAQINNSTLNAEIDSLGPQNDKFFLWHTWFNDVFAHGGFDIVIGNPPYIKEDFCRAAFDGFRETSPYFLGKMDIWYGFACHGIDMLAPHGILCFIAQNNWTTSSGAKKMRKKVVLDTQILEMMDFNDYMVFSEENPDGPKVQTMIMMFERDSEVDHYTFDKWCLVLGASKAEMRSMLAHNDVPAVAFKQPSVDRAKNSEGMLTFSGDTCVCDKISNGKIFLLDEEIAQGIVPNPDIVNARNRKNLTDQSIETGEGVFVVPFGKFVNIEESEAKYVKPLYEPYQMERYRLNENVEKQILYITKNNWQDDAPTLKEHLYKYREIMEQRRENQNGRINYMHLHWPRDERFFIPGEKILAVRKCVGHPIFAYTTCAAYVMMAVNVIKTDRWNMRFLTGVLNCKLIEYWLLHNGKMQGGNYQLDKEPLRAIPLPSLSKSAQEPIAELVEQILAAKKDDPNADTSALESEIDELVYRLYDLTPDEIAIVEGKER